MDSRTQDPDRFASTGDTLTVGAVVVLVVGWAAAALYTDSGGAALVVGLLATLSSALFTLAGFAYRALAAHLRAYPFGGRGY